MLNKSAAPCKLLPFAPSWKKDRIFDWLDGSFGTLLGTLLNRPNAHTTPAHVAQGADDFALPKNYDVRTYETKRGPF